MKVPRSSLGRQDKRCVQVKQRNADGFAVEFGITLKDRSFVKAVGVYNVQNDITGQIKVLYTNQEDKLFLTLTSGNLISDSVAVSVCNFIFCQTCSGGSRRLRLDGRPGWNYIVCGQIGDVVKMTFTQVANRSFGFCEVVPFGISGLYFVVFSYIVAHRGVRNIAGRG